MSYPPGGFPPPQYSPQGGFPQGAFPGAYPPPKKSKTGLIVAIVAAVALLVLCGVGGVAFDVLRQGDGASSSASGSHSSSSGSRSGSSSPSSSGPSTGSGTKYKVGDCLQVDDDSDQPGTCGDGSSPYKIFKIADSESGCDGHSLIKDSGKYLCLTYDVQKNYCYSNIQLDSEWLKPATTCKAPGTIVVFDVLQNTQDHSPCDADSKGDEYWYTTVKDPPQIICYWMY
jgi:hypothetical protein